MTGIMMEVVSRVLLLAILLLPRISPLVECALTADPRDSYYDREEDSTLDYDIHVPISAIPLGINVGASLKILSFREDVRTGELSWIARRGWLVVGDKLVALEGRDVSQLEPSEFADALEKAAEFKRTNVETLDPRLAAEKIEEEKDEVAREVFVTLRVRPTRKPGRERRTRDMYSPQSREEYEEAFSRWYLTFYNDVTAPLFTESTLRVTASVFGGEPGVCDAAMPVVIANPRDGCTALINADQVMGTHVVVRRGGCSFLAKALTVKSAGGGSLLVIDGGGGRMRMEAEEGQRVDMPVAMASKLDGEALEKAITSMSRARGKLVATLRTTAECLPQGDGSQRASDGQSTPLRKLSSTEGLQSAGISQGFPIAPEADNTPAESLASYAEEAFDALSSSSSTGKSKQMDRTTSDNNLSPEWAVNPPGGEGSGQCRETTSGPPRGGHLILEAADNSEYSLEFLSGSATGSLSINLEGEATSLAGKHNFGDTTPPVTILDDCFHQEDQPTDMANGKLLLIPPDRVCPTTDGQQALSSLQEHIAAQVIAIIVGKGETVASLATTGAAITKKRPSTESTVVATAENLRQEEHHEAAQDLKPSSVSPSDSRVRHEYSHVGQSGEATCGNRPLVIFLGHEEGKGLLRWIRDTIPMKKARLEEREDVAKLWGDVLWASDDRNWPKGHKQRRRILNRLRKTHSPEHASRAGGTAMSSANTGRWSLIQEAFDRLAVDQPGGGAVEQSAGNVTQVAGGNLDSDAHI